MSSGEKSEAWLKKAVELLKDGSARDPESEERLMARIRAEAARSVPSAGAVHGLALWNWFLRPRRIALSPLALGGIAFAFILLIAAGSWFASALRPRMDLAASAAPAKPDARHAVLFTLLAPNATRVNVVGDFNSWDPSQNPLERRGAGGVWAGIVMLPAGVYSYNFVVDGHAEIASDERPVIPAGDFGVGSSVVVVTEGSI